MENLQHMKFFPWVSEPYSIKKYFDEYMNALDDICGAENYHQKVNRP